MLITSFVVQYGGLTGKSEMEGDDPSMKTSFFLLIIHFLKNCPGQLNKRSQYSNSLPEQDSSASTSNIH